MTDRQAKVLRSKTMGLCPVAFAALVGMTLAAAPAVAQKAPDPVTQEVLIKGTLLTFNDANVTGNYSVMHARLSKPFRDKFPPERLKEVFKVFHEKRIDIDLIAAKQPIASKPAQVNDNGVLQLHGYFDTSPSRVHYELDYLMSDGEWKPVRINVQLK
jgi:hypothetical protein